MICDWSVVEQADRRSGGGIGLIGERGNEEHERAEREAFEVEIFRISDLFVSQ